MVFLRSFGAPEGFLEALASSCDTVLAGWAKQVAEAYLKIPTGEFNFAERWERAFMAARPAETTFGGHYVNWSLGFQYNCGQTEMAVEIAPPYAVYSFSFEFSTHGIRVRVSVKPGSLSGEKFFLQMADIYNIFIFGGWEDLS